MALATTMAAEALLPSMSVLLLELKVIIDFEMLVRHSARIDLS